MRKIKRLFFNIMAFALVIFITEQVMSFDVFAASSKSAVAAGSQKSASQIKTNKLPEEIGECKTVSPGIIYNKDKKLYYGPNGKGMAGMGFNYDAGQNIFYSSIDPWQRAFGYNLVYDFVAPLTSMYFKTRSIYFNYAGLNWMVKLWKGQYGITSGAEVGIYTRKSTAGYQYQCASKENFLVMDLEVLRYGHPYFKREAQNHWWQTGFMLTGVATLNSLELKTTITMKNKSMRDALVKSLKTQDNLDDVKYKVKGLNVSLDWK